MQPNPNPETLTDRQLEAVALLGDYAPRPGDLACHDCKRRYRPHLMTRLFGARQLYCPTCWSRKWQGLSAVYRGDTGGTNGNH